MRERVTKFEIVLDLQRILGQKLTTRIIKLTTFSDDLSLRQDWKRVMIIYFLYIILCHDCDIYLFVLFPAPKNSVGFNKELQPDPTIESSTRINEIYIYVRKRSLLQIHTCITASSSCRSSTRVIVALQQ
jgi:hypothetical protein